MRDNYYTIPIASSPPPSIGSPLPSSIPSPYSSNTSFLKNAKKCHKCMTMAALCLSIMGLFINLFHLNILTSGDVNGHYSRSQHWAHLPPEKKVGTIQQAGVVAHGMLNNNNDVSTTTITTTKSLPKKELSKNQINEMTIFQKMHSRVITALESCRSHHPILIPPPPPPSTNHRKELLETQNRRKLKVLSLSNNTPKNISSSASLISTSIAKDDEHILSPFGITNALSNIIHQIPKSSPNSQFQQQQCVLPPVTTCTSTFYSVIFTFVPPKKNNPFRKMFLQLLKLISYQSISEIIVFVPPQLSPLIMEKKDREYGTRLKLWDEDISHKVRLIYVQDKKNGNIWDKYDMNVIQPREEVLLYIHHAAAAADDDDDDNNVNNDEKNNGINYEIAKNDIIQTSNIAEWNERTFQVGFELFKRSSQAFVTYQEYYENYYNWNVALETQHYQQQQQQQLGEVDDANRRRLEVTGKVRKRGKHQKERPQLVKKKEIKKNTTTNKEKKEIIATKGVKILREEKSPLRAKNIDLNERKIQLSKQKDAKHKNNNDVNADNNHDAFIMANHFQPKCQQGLTASYPPILAAPPEEEEHSRIKKTRNHFFFIHRDYLCFLSHSLFQELRLFISKTTTTIPSIDPSSSSSNSTIIESDKIKMMEMAYYKEVMAVSTIISQLSGTAVHTFPLVSALSSSSSSSSIQNEKKPKKRISTRRLLQSNMLRNNDDDDDDDTNIMTHKNNILNNLFNYFGTIPPKPKYWCDFSSIPQEGGNDEKQVSIGDDGEFCQNGGAVVEVEKIPWMNKNGVGYDVCS